MNNSWSHNEAVLIPTTSPIMPLCEVQKLWYIGDYHIRSLIPSYFLNPKTFHDDDISSALDILRNTCMELIDVSMELLPNCLRTIQLCGKWRDIFKLHIEQSLVKFSFVHFKKSSLDSWALFLLKWCKNTIWDNGEMRVK